MIAVISFTQQAIQYNYYNNNYCHYYYYYYYNISIAPFIYSKNIFKSALTKLGKEKLGANSYVIYMVYSYIIIRIDCIKGHLL